MKVAEAKRETLLAVIELTRQQMCRVIIESRRGIASLRRNGGRMMLLAAGTASGTVRVWLPLLSTGMALIWLYRSLRQSSRGAHRR
jgi:hypothetical protein